MLLAESGPPPAHGFGDPHADTEEARRELGARLLAVVAPLL